MSKESQTIDEIKGIQSKDFNNRRYWLGNDFRRGLEEAVIKKVGLETDMFAYRNCGYDGAVPFKKDVADSFGFFKFANGVAEDYTRRLGDMLMREDVSEEELQQNAQDFGISKEDLKEICEFGKKYLDPEKNIEQLSDELGTFTERFYDYAVQNYIKRQSEVINDPTQDQKSVSDARERIWVASANKRSEEILKTTAFDIVRQQYPNKKYSDKTLNKYFEDNYDDIKSNDRVWKRVYKDLVNKCYDNGYIKKYGEEGYQSVKKYEPVFDAIALNQDGDFSYSDSVKNLLIAMTQVDFENNKAQNITGKSAGIGEFEKNARRDDMISRKTNGISARNKIEQIDGYNKAKEAYSSFEQRVKAFYTYFTNENSDKSNAKIREELEKIGPKTAANILRDVTEKQQERLEKSRRGKNVFKNLFAEENDNFYAESFTNFFDKDKLLKNYKRKVFKEAAIEVAKSKQLRTVGNLENNETLAYSMATVYSDFQAYELKERKHTIEKARADYDAAVTHLEELRGGKFFKPPTAENLKIVREYNESNTQVAKTEKTAVELTIEYNKVENAKLRKTGATEGFLPEDKETVLKNLKTSEALSSQDVPETVEVLQTKLKELERTGKNLAGQKEKQETAFNEAKDEVARQVKLSQNDETTKKQTLIVSKQKEIEGYDKELAGIQDLINKNHDIIRQKVDARNKVNDNNRVSDGKNPLSKGKRRRIDKIPEAQDNRTLHDLKDELTKKRTEANKIIAATQAELKAAEDNAKAEVGYDDKEKALNATNGLISQNNAEIDEIRKKVIDRATIDYSEAQKNQREKEQAKKELDDKIKTAEDEVKNAEDALKAVRAADREIIDMANVNYSSFDEAAKTARNEARKEAEARRVDAENIVVGQETVIEEEQNNPDVSPANPETSENADNIVDIYSQMTPDQRINVIINNWWNNLDKSKVFDQNGSVVDREYYTQAISQITLNKEIEQLVADESYNFNRIAITEKGYNELRNRIAGVRNNYTNIVNRVQSVVGASDFDKLNENDRIKFLINRRDLLLADNLKDINNPTNEEIVNAVKKATQQEYILDKVNNVVRNNIRVNAQKQQPARQPQVPNTAPQMGVTRTVKGFAGFVPSSYSSLEAQIALYNKVLDVYNSLGGITMGVTSTNVNTANVNNTGAPKPEPMVAAGNLQTDEKENKNIPDANEKQTDTPETDKKPPQTDEKELEPEEQKPEETYASSVTNLASDALFMDLRKNLIDVGGEKGIAPIGRVMADIVRIASPKIDDQVDVNTAELRMREICENTAVNAMVKNIIDEKLKKQTFENEQKAQEAAKEALMDLKERPAPYKNLLTGESIQPPSLYEEITEEVKGSIDKIFSGLTLSGKARYTLYQATQGKFNEKYVNVSCVDGKYQVEFSGSKQSLLYSYLSSNGISFNVSEYQKAAQKYLNEDMKLQTALVETTGKAVDPNKKVEVEQLKDDMGKPIENKYAVARYNKGLKILVECDKDGKVLLNEKDKQYNIVGLEINKDATKEEKEQAYDDMKDISEKVAEQVADEREKTIGDKLHEGEEITDENKELVESDRAKVRNAAKAGTQQNGNTADQYKAGVAPINSTPSTPSNDGPNM